MNYTIKTRPKIPRNKYGYLAPSSTGGATISNSTTTTITDDNADHALTADQLTNTVKLWGNDFNGTQDVNGNIQVTRVNLSTIAGYEEGDEIGVLDDTIFYKNLTCNSQIETETLYVNDNATFNDDVEFCKNIEVYETINARNANISETLTANDVNCDNVNCNDTVNTHYLLSNTIENSKGIKTKQLSAETITSDNITNSDTITTKNLNVTGTAHFFELIIDKIKSAGGSAMFTPADGFTIDKITERKQADGVIYSYTLYWKSRDDEGNARSNMWKVGDQALCMSFNQAKVGTNYNVSNKYYWALVNNVLENDVEIEGTYYNAITISAITADGIVNPEVGDNIVMCGHRKQEGETDTDAAQRGSAIYIAAYNGLDAGIKAPFISQYRAIKTFELATYRQSYFDATGARFVGDFTISPAQMQEIISQVSDGTAPYISDGSDGFTANHWIVWDAATKQFKDSGILAQGTNGVSVRIISSEVLYQIGDSGTVAPVGAWSSTIPSLIKGKYLWSKTTVNYSDNTTTTTYNVSYISQDGVTPIKGVDYKDGNDSVIYKLYPITEQAIVKANENLDITLNYLVYKQEGNKTPIDITSQIMPNPYPDWWYIVFEDNTSSTSTNVPSAQYNATYKTNYFTNHLTNIRSITVKLYNGNQLEDSRTVQVIYEPSATFEVNQELGRISSRVTDTENNITELTQTAEGLETRVAATETTITGVSDRVTTVETTASGLTTTVQDLSTDLGNTEARLTTVEQTANGLTSTVSKMNQTGNRINLLPESNLTGRCNNIRYIGSQGEYNTIVKNAYQGMNSYRAFIPVSNNFYFNGIRWGAEGYKAIRVTKNKLYTLTFYAKANVAKSKCRVEVHKTDGLYGNRIDEGSLYKEFALNSNWQQFTFTFTPVSDYIELYIFTYNAKSGTTTEDTVQDIEICMPLLTDNGVTEYSLSTEDKEVIQGNLLDNTNDFTLGGNLNHVRGTKGNFELSEGKYLYNNATGSYLDVLNWLIPNNKILSNTDYVLSFYAKSNSTGRLETIFYNDEDERGHAQARYSDTSEGFKADYYTFVNLTNNYIKYYVHFHTINNVYNAVKVLLRVPEGNAVYIAQPKLEIGADPTEWTTSVNDYETPSNVSSKIEQKAEQITLSVTEDLKSTGIDITNGQIALNADNTVVSNNLSVGSLETRGNNATITINEGQLKVYGTNSTQPNIVFGVDENGYAVLSYYDNNGGLLYNLGPDGIFNTFGSEENKFISGGKFLTVSSGDRLYDQVSDLNPLNGTAYYQFKEGYQWIASRKVKRYNISGQEFPSQTNDSYYNTNGLDVSKLPTGTLISDGAYITGVQPATDTVEANKRVIRAVYIDNGKIINWFYIYYKFVNNVWKLTDHTYNVVTNKTYIDYLVLTGQNNI